MSGAPCPACDVTRTTDPLVAFAVGVSLGAAFDDLHSITELMCPKHRAPYVLAMVQAQTLVNDEEPGE